MTSFVAPAHQVIDFTRDLTLYHSAAGELIRLARQSPAGLSCLQRLKSTHATTGLIEWSERIDDGVLILVAAPCAAMTDLIIELRTGAAETEGHAHDRA